MLFAAAESPWIGLAYMAIFVAMNAVSATIGFNWGRKVNSPAFVKSMVLSVQKNLIDRKENYKQLCVRYHTRINSAIALIESLKIKSPSSELEKIEKVLRGFDKLAVKHYDLGQLTPEHEIDISKMITSHKEASDKDVRANGG